MNTSVSELSRATDQRMICIQGLLRYARELVSHRVELQRATGEQFNLFQILGVGHYEVSTHSALLCNLLDPCGSHGQGSTFLKCFIAALNLDSPFDAESANVRPEVSIGPRTDSTGGRLDILITDKNGRQLAIENKVHAGEQENWVRRYRNGLRPDAHLIYLTLDGSSPSQLDGDQRDAVLCVSYADSILKWLDLCRKEAATVPIVRESLSQYRHLIQHLTHQNASSRMSDEIVKSVLQSQQDFDAYCALRDAEKDIKAAIVQGLAERLRPNIPSGFDMVAIPTSSEKHDGFVFTTSGLTKHNVKAVVSFDSPGYGACFYGFEVLDTSNLIVEPSEVWKVLTRHFKSKFFKCSSSGRWPAWTYWTLRKDWNDDVLRLIKFSSLQFDDEILGIIKDLCDVAQAFVDEMSASVSNESSIIP